MRRVGPGTDSEGSREVTCLHNDSALGFSCSYVVQRECPVGADAREDRGFTEVEPHSGDGFGGGGEGEVGYWRASVNRSVNHVLVRSAE